MGTAVDADGTVDVKDMIAANQKLQKEVNKKNYETHKENNAKKEAFLRVKDQKKAADAFALLAKRRLATLKKKQLLLEGLQQKHETLEASYIELMEEKAVLEESYEELKKTLKENNNQLVVGKVRVNSGGFKQWPLWLTQLTLELLVTPPSAIANKIVFQVGTMNEQLKADTRMVELPSIAFV